jgi:hypothetical protein
MSNTPIQFLLFQLENHDQDRTNAEAIWKQKELNTSLTKFRSYFYEGFELENYLVEIFIRTCLSRIDIDGDSVLDVFKSYHVQLNCYLAFDYVLRNGNPLDTAIQALHEKMLELVPEYREFITTK